METIDSFSGQYRFLSNFWAAPTTVIGIEYMSSEAAYQACKTTDLEVRQQFTKLAPNEAKKLGQQIQLRLDWTLVTKIECMELVLRAKFGRNPFLLDKLVATGNAQLIEGNTWGDTFWGVCRGRGTNYLGKLLMEIRKENL
jgi:ribA/ribD-fused uncharacterized protein